MSLTHIDIPPIKGKSISADHLLIDQDQHLLYVTDRTDSGIDVFDISQPAARYVKTIALSGGPNGIILAKDINRAYVGVSDSTVAVIDTNPASPKVGTVIGQIGTGGKAKTDDLAYYPDRKKLYAVNGDDGYITVIDATTNEITGKIDIQGAVGEQISYNPGDGMLYLVLSDDNVVERIDPRTDQLVTKSDIGVPCAPKGLAINPASGQALLGCSNPDGQHTLLWDLRTAKVIDTFAQVGAGDGATYDSVADRYFFAAVNFERGTTVGIFGGWPVHFLTNVPVGPGVKDAVYDEAHRLVYVVDGRPGQGGIYSFPLP